MNTLTIANPSSNFRILKTDEFYCRSDDGNLASAEINGVLFSTTSVLWTKVLSPDENKVDQTPLIE